MRTSGKRDKTRTCNHRSKSQGKKSTMRESPKRSGPGFIMRRWGVSRKSNLNSGSTYKRWTLKKKTLSSRVKRILPSSKDLSGQESGRSILLRDTYTVLWISMRNVLMEYNQTFISQKLLTRFKMMRGRHKASQSQVWNKIDERSRAKLKEFQVLLPPQKDTKKLVRV